VSGTRLRLNPIGCDAHGLCAGLLPELITLDEWGYPILDGRDVPAHLLSHARRAVTACPTLALALEQRAAPAAPSPASRPMPGRPRARPRGGPRARPRGGPRARPRSGPRARPWVRPRGGPRARPWARPWIRPGADARPAARTAGGRNADRSARDAAHAVPEAPMMPTPSGRWPEQPLPSRRRDRSLSQVTTVTVVGGAGAMLATGALAAWLALPANAKPGAAATAKSSATTGSTTGSVTDRSNPDGDVLRAPDEAPGGSSGDGPGQDPPGDGAGAAPPEVSSGGS
jgi:ferredoxin